MIWTWKVHVILTVGIYVQDEVEKTSSKFRRQWSPHERVLAPVFFWGLWGFVIFSLYWLETLFCETIIPFLFVRIFFSYCGWREATRAGEPLAIKDRRIWFFSQGVTCLQAWNEDGRFYIRSISFGTFLAWKTPDDCLRQLTVTFGVGENALLVGLQRFPAPFLHPLGETLDLWGW